MEKLIDKLKIDWTIPKTTMDNGEESFFRFACEFNLGIEVNDDKIPLELHKFYGISNGAILFKDVDFGQWGLKIIPYDNLYQFNTYTRSWRGDDIEDADLIIGEFLGDLDLVIISLAEYDYGQVIICPEIEKRKGWHFLKMNFDEFLKKYVESEGNKFWEN